MWLSFLSEPKGHGYFQICGSSLTFNSNAVFFPFSASPIFLPVLKICPPSPTFLQGPHLGNHLLSPLHPPFTSPAHQRSDLSSLFSKSNKLLSNYNSHGCHNFISLKKKNLNNHPHVLFSSHLIPTLWLHPQRLFSQENRRYSCL